MQSLAATSQRADLSEGQHPFALAMEALGALEAGGIISGGGYTGEAQQTKPSREQMSIFEVGVAPGIANKKFSARQMALLAELVGENGEMEYTRITRLLCGWKQMNRPTLSPG